MPRHCPAQLCYQEPRLYAETCTAQRANSPARGGYGHLLHFEYNGLLTASPHRWPAMDATSAYICSYEIAQMTSSVLAEYFSPRANVLEQVSDLGTIYNLPQDFPRVFAFLRSDLPTYTLHVDDPNLPENDRVHMQQYGGHSRLLFPCKLPVRLWLYRLMERQRRANLRGESL